MAFALRIGADQGPKKVRADLLKAWPREQNQFTVNVFDEGKAPVATYSVRNPHPIKAAANIKADPLPAEAAAGPVTVRLKRIKVHSRAPHTPYYEPEFEFLEQGKKSQDWSAEQVTWEDANGNQTGLSGPGQVGLCLREPVWIMKASVAKTPEAQFPPENLWSLPVLKLPDAGQCTGLSLSTNLQGVKLSIVGIGGPGKIIYSNGVPTIAKVVARPSRIAMSVFSDRIEIECERHHLMVDCIGLGKDQRLDLRYRLLPSGKPGPDIRMVASSGIHQLYPFKVEQGTEAIQVEAIVQTGHWFELAVQPPRK